MEVSWYDAEEIDPNEIKYVVMITEYQHRLMIIRNKQQKLWELPGGKRESGEELIQAASRELYEETGAIRFELSPFGVYLMNGSYGMMFFARVTELGKLPDYEIEEIRLVEQLPDNLLYGSVYYEMFERWGRVDSRNLNTSIVDYRNFLS